MKIDKSWDDAGNYHKDWHSYLQGCVEFRDKSILELNNYIKNHPQYKGTRGLPKEFSGIVKAISIINNLKYND